MPTTTHWHSTGTGTEAGGGCGERYAWLGPYHSEGAVGDGSGEGGVATGGGCGGEQMRMDGDEGRDVQVIAVHSSGTWMCASGHTGRGGMTRGSSRGRGSDVPPKAYEGVTAINGDE